MDNPWYSWQWFAPETFTAFTWEQPLYLFGLVALPLLLLALGAATAGYILERTILHTLA